VKTELAWSAGFFDGEGSISVVTRKASRRHYHRLDTFSIRLRLCQVRREPLDRFVAATGSTQRVRGPYNDRRPNAQPQFEWTADGPAAERILGLLWPYLSPPKREQAERVRGQVDERKLAVAA
jgi:hypothetical protein